MNLLNKIENNDKGLDISLIGTVTILVLFISFCSLFDFWILTYGKEQVVYNLEMYGVYALAKAVDYTDIGYIQNFASHFHASKDDSEALEYYKQMFKAKMGNHKGFITNVKQASEPICYCNEETAKIILDTGSVSFNTNKLLKSYNGVIPFIGSRTQNYDDDAIGTRVRTALRIITKY